MSMRAVLYVGRVLFGLIFIMTGYSHFTAATQAYGLSMGVPVWLTMLAGVIACVGGLCVATGIRSREGACLIAGFLVPVTIVMHRFWGLADPAMKQMQMINFMKNLSLFGAALTYVYFGTSPLGGYEPPQRIEARRPRATRVSPRELLTPGTRL